MPPASGVAFREALCTLNQARSLRSIVPAIREQLHVNRKQACLDFASVCGQAVKRHKGTYDCGMIDLGVFAANWVVCLQMMALHSFTKRETSGQDENAVCFVIHEAETRRFLWAFCIESNPERKPCRGYRISEVLNITMNSGDLLQNCDPSAEQTDTAGPQIAIRAARDVSRFRSKQREHQYS